MPNTIDWEDLARQLGLLRETGESSNSAAASEAIEIIVGPAALREAVDHYVSKERGYELARAVLWKLHPWSAMQRCHEIYRSDADADNRQSAVELLRVVADRRALRWVEEFLGDPDPVIQNWGMGIIDQLAWTEAVEPEELEGYLAMAEGSSNEESRSTALKIRRLWAARGERNG